MYDIIMQRSNVEPSYYSNDSDLNLCMIDNRQEHDNVFPNIHKMLVPERLSACSDFGRILTCWPNSGFLFETNDFTFIFRNKKIVILSRINFNCKDSFNVA